ncbi:MAG TPA: (Fe-S)-binding protein [Acidimicrobiia bacterium]|nr:(Fe-S)-binding protein [Acidimicrobiia bacterium]
MAVEVALFVTCLVDQLAPEAGVAAVRLLEAAGCTVAFPEAQSCCGQPALNTGEPEAAAVLARHFVEVFEPYDAVVTPSGSCAAMVHHWYGRILDGSWAERAEAVAARTYELTSFLVDRLDAVDRLAQAAPLDVSTTITVHDACHGLRILGLKSSARRLLQAAGATVLEMAEPEQCCGFGGTFAAKHGEISAPMADDKLAQAAATGAEYVTACDSGCLLHLAGRRRRTGQGPEPVHVAELLGRALR